MNIHGLKKSKKGMSAMLKNEEEEKDNQNNKQINRLKTAIRRCSEQIKNKKAKK